MIGSITIDTKQLKIEKKKKDHTDKRCRQAALKSYFPVLGVFVQGSLLWGCWV